MREKLSVKIPDIVIILLALGLTVFSAFAAYAKPDKTLQVLIKGPDKTWVFPLDAEETISVPGPLGDTVVQISENRAWVKSSPCENQTCVTSGHIGKSGDWVACLPNKVFLLIEGTDGSGDALDSIAW